MSKKFELIKSFYDNGTWSIIRVKNALEKNIITPEEFKLITGKDINDA